MHADNSNHLARWREDQELQRQQRVADLLASAGAGLLQWTTAAQFCALAGVSRSWLYESPHWPSVKAVRSQCQDRQRLTAALPRQLSSDDSLRARLASALDENKRLRLENQHLSSDLAHALGVVRELRSRQGRRTG